MHEKIHIFSFYDGIKLFKIKITEFSKAFYKTITADSTTQTFTFSISKGLPSKAAK